MDRLLCFKPILTKVKHPHIVKKIYMVEKHLTHEIVKENLVM